VRPGEEERKERILKAFRECSALLERARKAILRDDIDEAERLLRKLKEVEV